MQSSALILEPLCVLWALGGLILHAGSVYSIQIVLFIKKKVAEMNENEVWHSFLMFLFLVLCLITWTLWTQFQRQSQWFCFHGFSSHWEEMKTLKILYFQFQFPTGWNQLQVLDTYRVTVIMQYVNTAAGIHQVRNIISRKAQFKDINKKEYTIIYLWR